MAKKSKPLYVNDRMLRTAMHEFLDVLDEINKGTATERTLLPYLYIFLRRRWEGVRVRREFSVDAGNKRTGRIDFLLGTTNPVALEVACRNSRSKSQSASQNVSELRKLSRIKQSQAKRRVLVVFDLTKHPLTIEKFKASYSGLSLGPGRFVRSTISIHYIHRGRSPKPFPWNARGK